MRILCDLLENIIWIASAWKGKKFKSEMAEQYIHNNHITIIKM